MPQTDQIIDKTRELDSDLNRSLLDLERMPLDTADNVSYLIFVFNSELVQKFLTIFISINDESNCDIHLHTYVYCIFVYIDLNIT